MGIPKNKSLSSFSMKYQPEIGDPNSDPWLCTAGTSSRQIGKWWSRGFPVALGEGYESSFGVCSELNSVCLFPDIFHHGLAGAGYAMFHWKQKRGPSREFRRDYKVLMHFNRLSCNYNQFPTTLAHSIFSWVGWQRFPWLCYLLHFRMFQKLWEGFCEGPTPTQHSPRNQGLNLWLIHHRSPFILGGLMPGFEGPATFLTSRLKALGVTSIAIIRFSFLIRHLEVWTRNSVKIILPKSNLIGSCFFYDISKLLVISMKILDLTPNALSSQIARQSAVQNEELGSPKKPFTGAFSGGTKTPPEILWAKLDQIGEFIGDVLRCCLRAAEIVETSHLCWPVGS